MSHIKSKSICYFTIITYIYIFYGSIVNPNKNLGNPNKKEKILLKFGNPINKMGNPNKKNFLDYFCAMCINTKNINHARVLHFKRDYLRAVSFQNNLC